jgi:ferredoxin-NADP reductase
VRQYSLVDPAGAHPETYVVGVKRDPRSRGGSAWLHEQLRVGQLLPVGGPRNNFALDEAAAESVFIAGGIGITPIACMVQRLRQSGRAWQLHYSVRRREEAAFLDRVAGPGLHLHVDEEEGGRVLDIPGILAGVPPRAMTYCCGPAPMLDAFEAAARVQGLQWRVERFAAETEAAVGGGFVVRLAQRGMSIGVEPGQTILAAMLKAGIDHPSSCEQGICGACETRVLEGTPDHRDSLLSDEERRANKMLVCCSGSLTPELVLDL